MLNTTYNNADQSEDSILLSTDNNKIMQKKKKNAQVYFVSNISPIQLILTTLRVGLKYYVTLASM